MNKKIILIEILVIVSSLIIYKIFKEFELIKKVKLINENNCKTLKIDYGLEDFVKWENYLITGSDNRIKLWHFGIKPSECENGKLIAFNLDTHKSKEIILINYPSTILHPQGLYLLDNLLYVINHKYEENESVDIFELSLNSDRNNNNEKNNNQKINELYANFKRSIVYKSDKFVGNFNDLVAISKNEFYITTWLPFPDDRVEGRKQTILKKLKFIGILFLGFKKTHVYYCKLDNLNEKEYDGEKICKIVKGTKSVINNGIEYDFKDTLYVVDTTKKRIKVFKIDNNDHSKLIFKKYIKLNYAVDNIVYDKNNNKLYAGVLGKKIDYLKQLENIKSKEGRKIYLGLTEHYEKNNELPKSWRYSSGALEIDPVSGKNKILIMQEKHMFGVSVAYKINNLLYMGSFGDNGICICNLNN